MNKFNIIREIIKSAEDISNEETERKLYQGVKETTETLIKKNPNIKLSDIMHNLKESTYISAVKMLYSNDFESTVDLLLEISKETLDGIEENEYKIYQEYFKFLMVFQMVKKSHKTARRAVEEVWNGRNRTE